MGNGTDYNSTFLMWKIKDMNGIPELNGLYERYRSYELIAYAKNTSFSELISTVFPDREGTAPDSSFRHPIFMIRTLHSSSIGRKNLSEGIYGYLSEKQAV